MQFLSGQQSRRVDQLAIAEFGNIYSLVILVPSINCAIRRLHDIGKSGWNYLFAFLPIIGWIMLLVWFCRDSEHGDNQYGQNPKGEY